MTHRVRVRSFRADHEVRFVAECLDPECEWVALEDTYTDACDEARNHRHLQDVRP